MKKHYLGTILLCLTASTAPCFASQGNTNDVCGLNGPLTTSKVTSDKKITIKADLSKLTAAPVNASLDTDFSKTVDDTFQAVPDKVAACRIMLLEVSCIVVHRQDAAGTDLASKLVDIIGQKNVCSAEQLTGLKQALTFK